MYVYINIYICFRTYNNNNNMKIRKLYVTNKFGFASQICDSEHSLFAA